MQPSLADAVTRAPRAHDPDRGEDAAARFGQRSDAVRALIAGAAGSSPFLARLIEQEGAWLEEALDATADAGLDGLCAAAADPPAERAALMSHLRLQRRRAALLIALADLGGAWPQERVLAALSGFADACIRGALDRLAGEAGTARYALFGLGKLGAGELNYSSDVDLVAFFEDEGLDKAGYVATKKRFVTLTRELVAVLSKPTAEGYVHRVDLRLRPDPSATPLCIGMDAAERYYEGFARTWERGAWLKARVVAGDVAAGEAFLERMRPFVWRRAVDFAALEDVRDMKRRIEAHERQTGLALPGHDLKLGRGGIRAIEFLAQGRQLVLGGREPELRVRGTLEALDRLAAGGWINERDRDELREDYRVLRDLEHRLQMVEDAQTHSMPTEPAALERVAALAGFADATAMEADLTPRLARTAARFDALFAETEAPIEWVDEAALAARGFADPAAAMALLRAWAIEPRGATRSPRARAKLERLVPRILDACARAADPDRALAEIDRFLAGLPSGVQILSLFEANPNLLDLLTGIVAAAPMLAAYLGRNPQVLDGLLARDFFEPLPQADALEEEITALLPDGDVEGTLDGVRRWARERHFRVGAQLIEGVATPREAGRSWAALADACLRALVPLATAQAKALGPACVVAMGRLGAREMTTASDLDLLVVYDDGLGDPGTWARWTQRLVAALTVPTAEGSLYEVDMRLRPSGRSGPLATSLAAFARYQAERAWTWERMALTRARVVAGPPALSERVEATISEALRAPSSTLRADAAQMRARMVEADGAAFADPWNVKAARGGLTDIDFVLQVEQLASGLREPVTAEVPMKLGIGAEGEALDEARRLQMAVLHLARFALSPLPEAAPALHAALARATGLPDFAALADALTAAQDRAAAIFEARIGR